jgi:hypothetical protein
MKTPEILLASALVALVAGAGAALATRALLDAPGRAAQDVERPLAGALAPASTGLDEAGRRALDDVRLANTALLERVAALETRLYESLSTRTPLAEPAEVALRADLPRETAAALGGVELTPAFVASVDEALARIEAREDAEREERRRLQQAERVEERVMRLQAELGLSSRQASDMRTALLAQEEKRDSIFARMRDDEGDPRELRDSFRTVR